MPIPELRTLLHRFRSVIAAAARGRGRDGGGRGGGSGGGRAGGGRAGGRGRGLRRGVPATGGRGVSWARPRISGSALVQALIAGLIAVIGALLLASRLFSSRVSSFSRSDNLAAREAAEYGINELQAQLNTNQRGYLWVTRRDNWSAGSLLTSLNACNVIVQDASGNPATSLPALPEGVSSARTISNVGDTTITYQLTAFEPPALPDNQTTTTAQAAFCSTSSAAANFGNLNGGSALITVQGTVSRGGRSTSFRLTRRSHVASTTQQPAFSFMILGDAFEDKATKETFGSKGDISNLNYLDGNICYGEITDSSCFTPTVLPKTIIGCRDLGSCLINNVFNNDGDGKLKEKLSKYCRDFKAKKKVKTGFTCNEFQQAPVPPVLPRADGGIAPTPLSEGFTGYPSTFTTTNWTSRAGDIDCELVEQTSNSIGKDNDFASCTSTRNGSTQSRKNSYFPYYDRIFPTTLADAKKLRNSNLVRGCYFNNTNGSDTALGTTSTAINCLVNTIKISKSGSNDPNLVVYTTAGVGSATQLLPVNIFFHGTGTITFGDGGILGSDTGDLGWSRLRIIGREVATAADAAVSCTASSGIVSKKANDLNNLFLWLPNASLVYDKKSTKDNSYMVVWACEFTGPTKEKDKDPYSIITPLPESVVRAGLASTIGSRFIQSSAPSYRGYGSEDSSAP